AGAHVLVEKPLALTLAGFDELSALAAEKRRVLMCVHNWKYAPAYAAAHRACGRGRKRRQVARVGGVGRRDSDRSRMARVLPDVLDARRPVAGVDFGAA